MKNDRKRYYFDRLVINSDLPLEFLKTKLPIKGLKEHCNRLKVIPASNSGRYWGYQTKMVVSDATDEFVTSLSRLNLGTVGISYIEITMDELFDSKKEAEVLRFHLERNKYRPWAAEKQFVYNGTKNYTTYTGKKKGKKCCHYSVDYVVSEEFLDDADNNDFEEENLNDGKIKKRVDNYLHREHRLRNWYQIQKKLKINSVNDLGKAEDIFNMLEKKYNPKKELDRKKIQRKLMRIGHSKETAKTISYGLQDVRHFIEFLSNGKQKIEHKKHIRNLNRKMKGKARNLTKAEKEFQEWTVGAFLKKVIE